LQSLILYYILIIFIEFIMDFKIFMTGINGICR
jgi:hypothetical protein